MKAETQTISPEVEKVLAEGNALIAEIDNYLSKNGVQFPLHDWVTIAEYIKRFGLNSTNVVSNWIRRGIIPPENIVDFPELNNLRLIKAVPYQAK